MRSTVVVEVDDETYQFIHEQGQIDLTALVNQLIHEEKERQEGQLPVQAPASLAKKQWAEEASEALELEIDQNTASAD